MRSFGSCLPSGPFGISKAPHARKSRTQALFVCAFVPIPQRRLEKEKLMATGKKNPTTKTKSDRDPKPQGKSLSDKELDQISGGTFTFKLVKVKST